MRAVGKSQVLPTPQARTDQGDSMPPSPLRLIAVLIAALALPIVLLAGCGGSSSSSSSSGSGEKIAAVGAENEYANVIEQIGGKYVDASAIESNPNTDPHTFEASPSVAQEVSGADLVVQNGVGYDDYMEKIESASPSSSRRVIDVQKLLGLPDSTPNPHLWYKPETMPAVAKALVVDLSALQPAHKAYFKENEERFNESLKPWLAGLKRFPSRYPNATVATTEPVSDYMLEAAGVKNLTPFSMQADIMNGTDPAPQDVALQEGLFSGRKVKAFVYNQQVTDTLTETFRKAAAENGVPVVGVYETMPTGFTYQKWMLAELKAIEEAVAHGKSTEKL
jgi:zinc/manganese transport system substrate-binding protein